jgi:hypothetical protein
MRESTERSTSACSLQEIEANAFLLTVHLNNVLKVMREFARVPAAALILRKVETYLFLWVWPLRKQISFRSYIPAEMKTCRVGKGSLQSWC